MRARRPASRLAPPGRRPQAGPEPGTATLGVLRGARPCGSGSTRSARVAHRMASSSSTANAIPGSPGPGLDLEMDLVALNIGPDMMISGEEQRVAVGQRPTAFLERIRELGIVLPEPPGRSAVFAVAVAVVASLMSSPQERPPMMTGVTFAEIRDAIVDVQESRTRGTPRHGDGRADGRRDLPRTLPASGVRADRLPASTRCSRLTSGARQCPWATSAPSLRGTTNEVWNQGIGKYIAKYHALPGKGTGPLGSRWCSMPTRARRLNGQDDKPRIISYEYSLVYGLDGRVDETNAYACDWIWGWRRGADAPLNMLELVGTRWQGHNPMVTETNVRALDLANGGGRPDSRARRDVPAPSGRTKRAAARLSAGRQRVIPSPTAR